MNHIEQNELFTNLLRFLDSLTFCVWFCCVFQAPKLLNFYVTGSKSAGFHKYKTTQAINYTRCYPTYFSIHLL